MDTKSRILEAALTIVQHSGFDALSMREIAKKANVNLASINYHFGTKDNLLEAIFNQLSSTIKEVFTVFENESLSPMEKIKQFCMFMLTNVVSRIELISQMFFQAHLLSKSKARTDYAKFANEVGIHKLLYTIYELTGIEDPDLQTLMLGQMLGGISYLSIRKAITRKSLIQIPGKILDHLEIDIQTQVDFFCDNYFARYQSRQLLYSPKKIDSISLL